MKGRILVVEDDLEMRNLLVEVLPQKGFGAEARTTAAEAFQAILAEEFDAVITDLNLGGPSGISLCGRIHANLPDLPVIVITAFGSLDAAVAAIRAGAYDFITKPFEVEALVLAIERAVQLRSLRREVQLLRKAVQGGRPIQEIIGESPPMEALRESIRFVAGSDATVLITGETGTGKELVAKALHRLGPRSEGPFVAINCSAMPEPLLESELFGHTRGAFTDARSPREGLFSRASGGTLLLDEIGEMPLGLQPKILRAIEHRSVRPVGSDREVPFDLRFVAATNRDLETAVEEGRFREDLFFRINVIHLEVPPLRSRGGDILLLAQHFLARSAERSGKAVRGITGPAAERLLEYSWPGNVRELQNCIERALVFTRHDELIVEDLPEKIRSYHSSQVIVVSQDPLELASMEEVERRYILQVLAAVAGNKTEAARILGYDRRTLYRKLEVYQRGPDRTR